MKAISLHYQRNGVSGIGFYQFIYTDDPDKERKQRTFLATFTTQENEIELDWHNCRVVCMDEPNLQWRGDRIADQIQGYLFKTFGRPEKCLYELIVKVNSK
jgi:hypothetical protein